MHKKLMFYVLLFVLGAVGCQQPDVSPTPTLALPAAPPTEVSAATSEAAATSTLPPTATIAAVAATFTPIPTSTLSAEPSLTPTVEVPVWLLEPEDFGDDRNRLTGELVADPEVLLRRPIAVKISNSPPSLVRPQSGLSQADIVFEHVTEGPITRFTAIIYSQIPEKMGPIRSARLIDVELPAMYDAALAYSGSSIGVSSKLFGSDFRPRILRSNEPGYYRTGEDKPFEHTLFGIPESFWESLDTMEENHAPEFSSQMAFSTEPPPGGAPASTLEIRFRQFGTVNWEYDEETNRYWRWADDEEHIDANTGEQINAANVVLVFAIHQLDMSICEHQVGNTCHAFSTEIQIWGEGDAVILRDGQQYEVTWKRENRSDMLTFWDDEGNMVPLGIGNTWFQVIPYHYTDPVTISE
jgi:hypothetical protein